MSDQGTGSGGVGSGYPRSTSGGGISGGAGEFSRTPETGFGGATTGGFGATEPAETGTIGSSRDTDPSGSESEESGAAATIDSAKQKATEAAGTVKEQLSGAAAKASDVTNQATDQAAGGLHKAAEMLRERGGESGAAGTVAEKLESASGYLHETSSEELVGTLESLVRSKPTQTLLVAAGIGFLLGKITR